MSVADVAANAAGVPVPVVPVVAVVVPGVLLLPAAAEAPPPSGGPAAERRSSAADRRLKSASLLRRCAPAGSSAAPPTTPLLPGGLAALDFLLGRLLVPSPAPAEAPTLPPPGTRTTPSLGVEEAVARGGSDVVKDVAGCDVANKDLCCALVRVIVSPSSSRA